MTNQPGRGSVAIHRDGPLAVLEPGWPRFLSSPLEMVHHSYRPGGPRGFEAVTLRQRFYEQDADGRMAFPAGLIRRLTRILETAGYRVTLIDPAPPSAPRPPLDRRAELDDPGLTLLQALAQEPRGQIIVSTHEDHVTAIVMLARYFPTGRIVLVCATRIEAWRFWHRLKVRLTEPVAVITRRYGQSEARIEVGTLGSLDLLGAAVVILAAAQQALDSQLSQRLASLPPPRLYGLSTDRGLNQPRQRFRLEALVGPVLGRIGASANKSAEIRVLQADWSGQVPSSGPMGLAWKRAALWGNEARNQAIATIAQALVGGDASRLGPFGLFLDPAALASPTGEPLRVSILVEAGEHARELARRLPGWRMLRGQDHDHATDGARRLRGAVDPAWESSLDRTIMTQVHASHRSGLDVDVVIRADGTPWPLNLPLPGAARNDDGLTSILIIDLHDVFDPVAQEATRERWRDYQERGWVSGTSRTR